MVETMPGLPGERFEDVNRCVQLVHWHQSVEQKGALRLRDMDMFSRLPGTEVPG
jgi:hypothetical protein